MFTNERCFWYKIYELGPEKVFTVAGCSPKTNRAISPTVKIYGKNGTGKKCTL